MIKSKIMPVLPGRNKKPLDLGIGRMSASIMPDGRICSVNTSHSKHGFITLTHIEQMPDGKWYETEFVRSYRRRIAVAESGFGLVAETGSEPAVYLAPKPLFTYVLDQVEVISAFDTQNIVGVDTLVQRLQLTNKGEDSMTVPVLIGGRLNLTRCSYGQLTERGPIPIPPAENKLTISDNRITLCNTNLDARADLVLFDGEQPLPLPDTTLEQAEPIDYQNRLDVEVGPGETRVLTLIIAISEGQEPRLSGDVFAQLSLPVIPASEQLAAAKPDWQEMVIQRNLEYIFSCCAIPLGEESVCVMTDHQLLPLSWNRDSYYQLELVRASYNDGDDDWKQQVQALIKGHLLWMYEDAQRPEEYWGRAYLVNGVSKDQVFQLDQQCYPLLELCEYYEQYDDAETVQRCLPVLKAILVMLEDYRAEGEWLYETGETPADDDVVYPYHFSSQVLVWHTFTHLDRLNTIFNFTDQDLGLLAENVRTACLDAFATEREGKPLFAYLTDLNDHYQFYHDANDLPTVYAPLWGFCEKDNPHWLGTMEFAFSTANEGGYYAGRYEGLGSVHTPHKWPLGDGQELLYAWMIGDDQRLQRVLGKLEEISCWDGMFNEAVDENSGVIVSRHWFSWPGAFIGGGLKMMRN